MANKKKSGQVTLLELEIMQVLWGTGPATVQIVQQRLERKLAYTTVQTMLNLLHDKGKVKRVLKNRAYHYRPAVSHRQVATRAIVDIIDRLFGGSAEGLVMGMVQARRITPEKLARLTKMLDKSKEEAEDGDDQ